MRTVARTLVSGGSGLISTGGVFLRDPSCDGPGGEYPTANYPAPRRGIRRLLAGLIFLAFSCPAFPDNLGLQDPEFAKVPFAEWFSGAPEVKLKWSQRILPITLSPHQRLVVPVQIQ